VAVGIQGVLRAGVLGWTTNATLFRNNGWATRTVVGSITCLKLGYVVSGGCDAGLFICLGFGRSLSLSILTFAFDLGFGLRFNWSFTFGFAFNFGFNLWFGVVILFGGFHVGFLGFGYGGGCLRRRNIYHFLIRALRKYRYIF
jgi:hypothetical protein